MKTFALLSAFASVLPLFAGAATTPAQAQAVRDALTAVDKINVLQDADFVFNFNDPTLKKVSGAGGKLVSANVGNFAALVGNGLALTLGFMEPCGMNSPHTHPRATEILLLLNGTISAGFLTENGSRFVVNNVTELSAMVFPKGSIHFQANFGCDPVQFVAALSDEDPGVLQVAQRFFALPADVVGSSLGGLGVKDVESLAALIPDNMIAGTQECYQRCGLTYPSAQSTAQQQASSTSTTATASATGTDSTTATAANTDSTTSADKTTWTTSSEASWTTSSESSATTWATSTDAYATTTASSSSSSPAVIDVIVGKDGGLTFDSDDVSAMVGDVVRFHFVAKNHTVTRSSFAAPCTPLDDATGFDSGFQFIAPGAAEKTFDVTVKDDKPIWFYCRQKAANATLGHCQQGMNGAVNAPKSGNTLAAFQAKARSS